MSSSTSSSRKIYLKMFLAIVLGMTVSLVLIRLFALANGASSDTILDRVTEARTALPRIVDEEHDLVMFFGSSMTDAGFSPRQFDRQVNERGGDVKSFNFGFGGLNPYFQDYFSRRIEDAFREKDRRLELVMIEFNPFQTTTSRYNGAIPVIDSFVTMLGTPKEIWDITLQDPERGIRMFNIYYLRDKISAEMVTSFFGRGFRPPRPRSSLPPDEELTKRLRELGQTLRERLREDFPDYSGADWFYDWQGGGPVPEERSESTLETFAEYYELLRNQRRMENDRLNRIACCDIEELHFEEKLIAAFIRIVENFQRFSNHVEVIMLPRNTDWIQYSPEAAARLAAVVERIERATGVTIRDMQDLDVITPQMFSDTTHLARYSGEVVFTTHLVEEYAPLLVSDPR